VDVLTLIKRDHAEVKAMFKEFAGLSNNAKSSRTKLAKKIIEALVAHNRAEEETAYAAVRERVKSADDRIKVLEGYEEHGVANDLIAKIEVTDLKDDNFVARMDVLRESVEHHIKEEESVIHKIARSVLDKEELNELGARFEEAKQQVPA